MIGKTISHYKILEKLGEGGMGVIYKAEDTKLKRTVALKFLPREYSSDISAKERFIHEAQAASALDHPNICTIHEIAETDDGQSFIAMACYDGYSLQSLIFNNQLSIEKSLDIAIQIAKGLQRAHEAGILHRDIKPANIIITEHDEVKILDFGLAKLAGQTRLTKEGMTVGTAAYMSPEQSQGNEVNQQTDIWSLGVILYEMLSGQLPFKGEYDQAIVYSILNEDPCSLREINSEIKPWIERSVLKMLEKDPIERYQNISDVLNDLKRAGEKQETELQLGFMKNLLERRVPHIMGIYLLAVWLFIQLIGWIISQFLLSPHLIDFSKVILLSLLPTVLIITYFHGKSGKTKWRMIEKISIPMNLLISGGLLFFMFYSKDLGAALKTVSYEDEEGNKIERIIPKSEFRKSIAIFPFDYIGDDSTQNWIQYGIPFLIFVDLVQDLYINPVSAFHNQSKSEMKIAGFPDGLNLPLSFKGKMATEMYRKYFICGNFDFKDNNYSINIELYQTEGLKSLAKRSFSGFTLLSLLDDLTLQIRRDLDISEKYIDQSKDYPLNETMSNNVSAIKLVVLGENAFRIENDLNKARDLLEQSISIDSTFMFAYVRLSQVYRQLAELDLKSWALDMMMRYIYRVPEKIQFIAKNHYFQYKGEKTKQLAVTKMWVDLYPDDRLAREELARLYIHLGEIEKAIDEYKYIMKDISDEGEILQRISILNNQRGEYEQTIQLYEQYINKKPNDYRCYIGLGETYLAMSDFQKSREYYNKAQLLEPTNIDIKLKLAEIEIKLGNFDNAEQLYHRTLRNRKIPDERIDINEQLENFYRYKGQLSLSLEYGKKWLENFKESAQYYEVTYQWQLAYMAPDYASIGRIDTAFTILRDVEKAISKTHNHIPALYYMLVHLQMENPDSAAKYVDKVGFGFNRRADHYFGKARINELNHQFEQALQDYEECLNRSVNKKNEIYAAMGRTFRKMGQYGESKNALDQALQLEPFYAYGLYEMALLNWEQENEEKAMDYLSKALDIWKDADPEYIYAQLARNQKKEWDQILMDSLN